MRLLNTDTLQLESFIGEDARPEYAILSHTWGKEEVLYDDVRTGSSAALSTATAGGAKIVESCAQAKRDGFGYIWIDTCCIDKSSSAELSEAINSMFKWYQNAGLCYAHLVDVASDAPGGGDELDRSRWFRRGWTLQELIAPAVIHFYNQTWSRIGTRHGLASRISGITGIGVRILARPSESSAASLATELRVTGVSTRMSWARERRTTREEDTAYCLMGIFDVNMPLLYGEGAKAFIRLQEEIVRGLNDQSILAWLPRGGELEGSAITSAFFAPSPHVIFEAGVSAHPRSSRPHSMRVLGKGLEIEVFLGLASFVDLGFDTWIGILNCHATDDFLSRPAILLKQVSQYNKIYMRGSEGIVWLGRDWAGNHRGPALWHRDNGPPSKVTLSMSKVERTTIMLNTSMGQGSAITAPPLYVSLKLSSTTVSYKLFASTPPERDGYVAPWGPSVLLPPLAWPTAPPPGSTGGLGALLYRSDGGSAPAFFILWSVDWYPTDDGGVQLGSGRSWWDKSAPVCSILSWAEVMGSADEAVTDRWNEGDAFYDVMYGRPLPTLPTGMSSCQVEHRIGDIHIKAKIGSVDSFGRRAFELSVDIRHYET